MQANPDKCHIITSCDNETSICLNNYNITNVTWENVTWEKMLGIKIDHI